jgi:hypothetical protein
MFFAQASFDEVYAAPGELTVPIYLRWALLFEDPEERTLWLFKALPREWLNDGEEVAIAGAPTRFGNLSLSLQSHLAICTVDANVSLPTAWSSDPSELPPGGVVLRLRAPAPHTGKLQGVTVGGVAWPAAQIDAAAETVSFTTKDFTPTTIAGMETIVATFAGC